MKLTGVIKILFLFLTIVGFSQGEEAFQRGNSLYNQEKYQEAIDAYTTILNSKQESAALYYNLANAYYKLGNIGSSIYYYEKALQLAPNDEDVANNLAFAKNATIDSIDTIPQGFISKTLQNMSTIFSSDGWAWFAILTIISFVLCFIGYYYVNRSLQKRVLFMSAIICIVCSFMGIALGFKHYNDIKNYHFAIIFAKETTVKSEPNLRSEAVFELHEGTKVAVLETVNNWKKIKLSDGKIGWIPKVDLKEL